jgi:hypothetical protein
MWMPDDQVGKARRYGRIGRLIGSRPASSESGRSRGAPGAAERCGRRKERLCWSAVTVREVQPGRKQCAVDQLGDLGGPLGLRRLVGHAGHNSEAEIRYSLPNVRKEGASEVL